MAKSQSPLREASSLPQNHAFQCADEEPALEASALNTGLLKRCMVRRFLLSLLCAVSILDICSAKPELAHGTSRRFRLQAPDSSQLVSLARWAEDVADRIESTTELTMSFDRSRVFQIVVLPSDDSTTGQVRKSQRFLDGRLVQQLIIKNFEQVDWQDVLEAHTSLLVNGYIVARQNRRQSQPPEAPDWLTFGLAHYIDSQLRTRSGRLLVRWQEQGEHTRFSEMLKWQTLPRGQSAQKSACCVALSWLLATPMSSNQLHRIFSHLAAGESLSAQWMATEILAMESVDAMEDAWRQWTDKHRLPKADLGVLSSVLLNRLSARLTVRSGESGIPDDLEPSKMSLKDLIAIKKSSWIPEFCTIKSMQLDVLSAGKPVEFRQVVDLYRDYLGALKRQRRDATLARLLSKATSALEKLQATTSTREEYVDEIERKYSGITPSAEDNREDDRLERSSFQDYVDEVEKCLIANSANTNVPVVQKDEDDKEDKNEDGGRQD